MKKAILISLGLVGLAIAACKKDSGKKTVTTSDMLTASAWKYDTVTLDLDKNGIPDSSFPPGYIQPCQLDNTITFNKDKSGVDDEGPTKCDSSAPQTNPFTWALSNGDSTLTITGNSDAQLNGAISIKEISDTKMVLLKNIVINDVITIDANVIVTLKR